MRRDPRDLLSVIEPSIGYPVGITDTFWIAFSDWFAISINAKLSWSNIFFSIHEVLFQFLAKNMKIVHICD